MSTKTADKMPNDENRTVSGEQKVRPDPPGRKPGTIQAKWGDKPALDGDGDYVQHGLGAVTEAEAGRKKMLEEVFEDVAGMSKAEKSLVNHYFETPESERRTPHSPLLQKSASERSSPTLREQIHGIMKK